MQHFGDIWATLWSGKFIRFSWNKHIKLVFLKIFSREQQPLSLSRLAARIWMLMSEVWVAALGSVKISHWMPAEHIQKWFPDFKPLASNQLFSETNMGQISHSTPFTCEVTTSKFWYWVICKGKGTYFPRGMMDALQQQLNAFSVTSNLESSLLVLKLRKNCP